MKQPPNLFPRIPYTRQRGRVSNAVTRGENVPYTGQELIGVRARLLERGGKADCPRCRKQLDVVGPIALRRGGGGSLMWTVRCEACRKHANIRVQALATPPAVSDAGLVVSNPTKPKLESRFPPAAVAIAVHAAVMVTAVVLTAPAREPVSMGPDTAVVFLSAANSVQPRLQPLPPAPVPTDLEIQGFKTLIPPIVVPTEPAAIDLNNRFDPRDYSGVGVEGAAVAGLFGDGSESEHDPNRIWPSSALPGEPPRLLASPRLDYPAWMRNRGIEGFVVLEFVIDTAGLVEQRTIEVIQATHEGFIEPAKRIVSKSIYRAGRVRGRPVRVLSQVQINFSLTDAGEPR
jgi:hypothetical protein